VPELVAEYENAPAPPPVTERPPPTEQHPPAAEVKKAEPAPEETPPIVALDKSAVGEGEPKEEGALENATEEDLDVHEDETAQKDMIEIEPADEDADPPTEGEEAEPPAAIASNDKVTVPQASGSSGQAEPPSEVRFSAERAPAGETTEPPPQKSSDSDPNALRAPARYDAVKSDKTALHANDKSSPHTPPHIADKTPAHPSTHAEKAPPHTPDKTTHNDKAKDAHAKNTKNAPSSKISTPITQKSWPPWSSTQQHATHKDAPHTTTSHAPAKSTHHDKPKHKTYGLLAIEANPNAVVAIDGNVVGFTPLLHVKLETGRHDVALMKPYTRVLRWRKIVTVYEGKKHRIALQ
jgi:hypothetical protein